MEQNFDCAHELIHFLFPHPPIPYFCEEGSTKKKEYYEWEANEGAAELLIPHSDFIPNVCAAYTGYDSDLNYLAYFSEKYMVTENVIRLRIKNLSYEIDQYLSGVPVDSLKILSKQSQTRKGLNVVDFTAVMDFGRALDWEDTINERGRLR
jgi:Zn-dependent peptidase ImmA (M78 family)